MRAQVVLSTAHVAKFPGAVGEALSLPAGDAVAALEGVLAAAGERWGGPSSNVRAALALARGGDAVKYVPFKRVGRGDEWSAHWERLLRGILERIDARRRAAPAGAV